VRVGRDFVAWEEGEDVFGLVIIQDVFYLLQNAHGSVDTSGCVILNSHNASHLIFEQGLTGASTVIGKSGRA
jgi:hypothetical protein